MGQLKDDCFAFGEDLISTDAALNELRLRLTCISRSEEVELADGIGRILAADLKSKQEVPAHDNSAVDGYAVYFDDISQTGETKLPIKGRITAGHPLIETADMGNAYRIFTGAPMPNGPDTVLMQEDCVVEDNNVIIPKGIKRGANRRFAGEDIKPGNIVITKGQRLRPQEIGLSASIGIEKLPVYRQLRVALFSTGDEVCDIGDKLRPGTIFDSNRYSISALLHQLGCKVSDLGIISDKIEVIRETLISAAFKHDVIISSAGVSTGEEDHVRRAVAGIGCLYFWRVAIRPGRPITFGQIKNVPFIGLPGNPVASMVTFMRFARPALLLLNGATQIDPKIFRVPAAFNYEKKRGRREWVRAALTIGKKGVYQAEKFPLSGAGILTSMVESDGLVELSEEQTTIKNGNMVDFLPFSEVS